MGRRQGSEEHGRPGASTALPPHGPRPHLSLRHCQLFFGLASSSSLRPFFLLPLTMDKLGVGSLIDSWLQNSLMSGSAGQLHVSGNLKSSSAPPSGVSSQLWAPGGSSLSVKEFDITQAPHSLETEP